MTSTIMVTYETKPLLKEVHVGLINEVFAQLKIAKLENFDYKVLCSNDGVTFTHISTFQSEDGTNPVSQLKAFQNFGSSLQDRVVSPPRAESVTLIGNYTEQV